MNNTSDQLAAPISSSSQSPEMSPLTAILSLLVLIAIPSFLYALFFAINYPSGIATLGRLVTSSSGGGSGGRGGGGLTDDEELSSNTSKIRRGQLELVSRVKYCKETNGEEYGNECPVCLSGFIEGDHVRQLNSCKHSFHVACIDKWLLYSHSNCPLCRASVPVKPPTVIPKSSSSSFTAEQDFRLGLPDSGSLV